MLVVFAFLVTCGFPCPLEGAVPSPPYIIRQPPTTEILFETSVPNLPIFLDCEATGEPAPRYTWLKNGKPFDWQIYHLDRISQDHGRGSLIFSQPSDEDIGQYQCLAMNEHGTAASNTVFLSKGELKAFEGTQPMQVTGNEGESLKLECKAPEGYPKPVILWIRLQNNGALRNINESRLTKDPEGNLWFSNVTKGDASADDMYTCVATSALHQTFVVGHKFSLKVVPKKGKEPVKNGPVRQYVSARQTIATLGGTHKLYCIYGGSPLPQTTWSKGGKPVKFSERIFLEDHSKSLVLKNVGFEDEGNYTCHVSNGVGRNQSHTMTVKVEASPFFTIEPQIANAVGNETVEFYCEAHGVPKPKIKWTYNGKDISESPRTTLKTNKIVIERVDKSNVGNYGCNASNTLGYIYKDVYLNVLSIPPQIIEPPHDMLTVDGLDITLTCRIFAVPKATLIWQFEKNSQRFTVDPFGNLHLRKVRADDSGLYTCLAENRFGKASAQAKLLVRNHTKIIEAPANTTVVAGGAATFHCNALSDDSLFLEINWLRFGLPIDFDKHPNLVKFENNSLTILKVVDLDAGTYTCVATTALDQVSSAAELIAQDVPSPPLIVGLECKSREATIKWTDGGNNKLPVRQTIFEYSTGFEPDTWIEAANITSSKKQYKISLSPWTNYTFRVIAANQIGKSSPSEPSDSCQSAPDVPYKNPDHVKGQGDQPGSMTITWTAMPEFDHNARGFHYNVYWKRDAPHSEYQVQNITDWKTDRLVVANLGPNEKFKIKVVALNELGEARVAPVEATGRAGAN